jgi:hypothetical protein
MPEGYFEDLMDEGSIGEQLLGKGEKSRTTKTFIEDGTLATLLGLMKGLQTSIVNTGKRLYAEEKGISLKDVSWEDLVEVHPEAQEALDIHQAIIEHKGSQQGFLVDRFVNRNRNEELDEKKKKHESSGEIKTNDGNAGKWK